MTIQAYKRTKKINKQIKINIERRTVIVDDQLVYFKDVPIPSWIELSLIDVCNRKCVFCPKSDPSVAPDTHQKMNMKLITKLAEELKESNTKVLSYFVVMENQCYTKISTQFAEN